MGVWNFATVAFFGLYGLQRPLRSKWRQFSNSARKTTYVGCGPGGKWNNKKKNGVVFLYSGLRWSKNWEVSCWGGPYLQDVEAEEIKIRLLRAEWMGGGNQNREVRCSGKLNGQGAAVGGHQGGQVSYFQGRIGRQRRRRKGDAMQRKSEEGWRLSAW